MENPIIGSTQDAIDAEDNYQARADYFANEFRELIINREYDEVDEMVREYNEYAINPPMMTMGQAVAGIGPAMTGVGVYEWLSEVTDRRREVGEMWSGVNVRTNALELMSDYFDYLTADLY